MKPDQTVTKNVLLALLSPAAFSHMAPSMHIEEHPCGKILVERNDSYSYAYFPEKGMVSSVIETDSGFPIEVGTVGREGFAGIPMLLGSRISELKLFSQLGGWGWHIAPVDFERLLTNNAEIRQVLNRFTMTTMFQSTQTIACNRVHSMRQRCARWLLAADDREQSRTVDLTSEYLAMMIGDGQGVARTLDDLNYAGLIRYDDNSVELENRDGLEAAACGCYAEIRMHFEQTMGLGRL